MWLDFFKEIGDRIKDPFKYPQYLGYFIFCILIVGATGVHLKFYDFFINSKGTFSEISKESATYLIAILGSSVLDLNLSTKIKNKDSMLIWSFIILVTGVALVVLIVKLDGPIANFFAIFGVLLAWFMWWFANSDNENLTRETHVTTDSVTGGDPNRALSGNIVGFKS